jgi:hypothetical protein
MVAGAAQAGVSGRCAVPDTYLKLSAALDRTGDLIGRRRPVRILMFGPELDATHAGVPTLEGALETRLPGINFEVSGDRAPGLAEDDFDRLRETVAARAPDLVVWQVGVRDAQALSNVDDFETVLDQAAAWAEAVNVDLVLMDPPFIPQIGHERIYIPYVGEIGETSRTEQVPLLRRYAAMQYWNIEREKRRGPLSDLTAKQPCVTELLAEAITRATSVAAATPAAAKK